MGAAKEHGSPLGYSVFQQILQGRGLDGAFETPQALTLSDIRSPGNLGQVQVFLKMFMDKTYHFWIRILSVSGIGLLESMAWE